MTLSTHFLLLWGNGVLGDRPSISSDWEDAIVECDDTLAGFNDFEYVQNLYPVLMTISWLD